MTVAPIYLDTSAVLRVCDVARAVSPTKPLRAFDALHLATFVIVRRKIDGLALLTTDTRLAEAAGAV